MKTPLLILALCAALALTFTACGDDDSSSEATDTADTKTAGSTDTSTAATEVDTSTKPEVQVPEGEPSGALLVEDIVEGSGAEAKPGDQVTVQYVGVDYETGEQFDASWDSGQPFPFVLGSGNVILGWDQGVAGMKVGGRRRLIIPPDLAYGPQGSPPAIGPNATLIFVVDLLDVTPG